MRVAGLCEFAKESVVGGTRRRPVVIDPGAYSGRINERLDAQNADERAAIVGRIAEIEAVLTQRGE